MTPQEMWDAAQLCKRLHPHTPHEGALIEQLVAWLELIATKGMRQ